MVQLRSDIFVIMPSSSEVAPPEWKPHARADVLFRRVGEDWVLFDSSGHQLHVMNLTAALVWSYCTGEHPGGTIEAEVGAAFPDSPDDPGVRLILEDFRDADLFKSE